MRLNILDIFIIISALVFLVGFSGVVFFTIIYTIISLVEIF